MRTNAPQPLIAALIVTAACARPTGRGPVSAPLGGGAAPLSAESATLDPEIAAMVRDISMAEVRGSLEKLVSFGTRNSCSDPGGGAVGIGGARDWIRDRHTSRGSLRVALDPYPQSGCDKPTTASNIVAWIPGRRAPERIVVVGGHYDSRSTSRNDPQMPAPGANDSGSQTAVVLEAARVMSKYTFDTTVAFVSFAGEEQGLVGSAWFARHLLERFPGSTVDAALICDIVGGDRAANDDAKLRQFRLYATGAPREIIGADGTTDSTSPSRNVMRHIGAWGSAYVPEMTMVPKLREDRPRRGSDHMSFLDQGWPGVRFIETDETLDHQHTADDTIENMTPEYAVRVAKVLVASAATLARAPSVPAHVEARGEPGGGVSLRWDAAAGAVDHYVVAARSAREVAYRRRVRVAGGERAKTLGPGDLGVAGEAGWFVSVAAVDGAGHESLFAYPEHRCTDTGCAVPEGALDVRKSDRPPKTP